MSSAEAKNTGRRVRISAGNRTWYATLDDNATARALIAKLPLTLPLEDLYGRELCYRFRDALQTKFPTAATKWVKSSTGLRGTVS
jgi:hypothetical protein